MTPGHANALEHRAVLRWHLACGALALLVTLGFASPRAAASLLAGAALGLANFHALFRFSARALLGGGGGPVSGFALRFVLLALALWMALALDAEPVALLAGLSLIMPAVLLAAWQSHRRSEARRAPRANADDDAFKNWNPWLARERAPREDAAEPQPRDAPHPRAGAHGESVARACDSPPRAHEGGDA